MKKITNIAHVALVGALGTLIALNAGLAMAHDPSSLYWPYVLHEWKSSHHTGLHITWRFGPGFPDGPKRSRVLDAFAKWNQLDQQMDFERLSDADDSYDLPCSEPQGYNGILWRDLPPGISAQTAICDHESGSLPYAIHNFWIAFENDGSPNWFHGDDPDNIGSNELDFEAVATHEIGHATGWAGHFDEDSERCTGPGPIETMCPGFVFGTGTSSTKARSLEVHDKHTFDNNYPDD